MNGGKPSPGYTIVEVMIFLAVSSMILVSALFLINGQQQKTQFAQAIREIDSKIRDIMNDVSSGVYVNTSNIRCVADQSGNTPVISASGTNTQGGNAGCTFIGRVLQFDPSGSAVSLNILSVAGRQFKTTFLASDGVKELTEAKPMPITPNNAHTSLIAPGLDDTEYNQLSYGLRIKDNADSAHLGMSYIDSGGGTHPIGAFGLFSNFTNYSTGGASSESGKQFTDVWAIPGSTLGDAPGSLADRVIDIGSLSAAAAAAAYKNPPGGVILCFVTGSGGQYGMISIGDNRQRLTTTLKIGNRGDGSTCT